MYLRYIWIKKYGIISETGFNLDSAFTFSYNLNDRVLLIEKNDHSLSGFFGESFSAVTAIVGKNGSGKSSILAFIARNLANHKEGIAEVYEDGNFFAVFDNFILARGKDLIRNGQYVEDSGFKIVDYEEVFTLYGPTADNGAVQYPDYRKLSYVYYSNTFDIRFDYNDPSNLVDVTTNSLLWSESFISEEENSKIWQFYLKEKQRLIEGVSAIMRDPPFRLPEKFYIRIKNSAKSYKHVITIDDLEKKDLTGIAELCKKEHAYDTNTAFILLLYKNILKSRGFKRPELYKSLGYDQLKPIYNVDGKIVDVPDLSNEESENVSHIISLFIAFLAKEETELKIEEDRFDIVFTISEDNSPLFEFLTTLRNLIGTDSFLEIDFRNLSSGEYALLSVIGRLNYANMLLLEQDHSVDHVFLIMDETDLYLHPEWQRIFFNILITILPRIFPKKKIQLLITTHSPFLVSDIPKSNLIYLSKEESSEGDRCQVLQKPDKETFGANIYSLLADSFFLENGFVGEFAKIKIGDLYESLLRLREKGEVNMDRKELLREIQIKINMIGEPTIRKKLEDLFLSATQSLTLENQIVLKRQELDMLESKRKNEEN